MVAVLLLLAVLALGYVNRERLQPFMQAWFGQSAAVPHAASAPVAASSAPHQAASAPQAVASAASAPWQWPASTASLPDLRNSDALALRELGTLLDKPGLAWLVPRHLILHLVATVDNLTRPVVPLQVWPVHPLPGALRTTGQGDTLALAPDNARRYAPYVQALTAIAPQRAVAVYLQLSPLFEQAWRELGHPKSAFNDRLLAVIANLLQAPEPEGPVFLRQPKVLYTYADPALEAAPAGQKILLRMGLQNERAVKGWLRQFRQALLAQRRPAAPGSAPGR
jgi:hypothetical protein